MQEHKRGAGIDKETSETHRHFRSRPISIQNIIYEHREMMDFFFFYGWFWEKTGLLYEGK